jgi:hypothetical protein
MKLISFEFSDEDQTPPPTAPPGIAPPMLDNHFADFDNMESAVRDGKSEASIENVKNFKVFLIFRQTKCVKS